jgi:hypothetical protein
LFFYADKFTGKNRKISGVVEGVEKQDRICYSAETVVCEFNDY